MYAELDKSLSEIRKMKREPISRYEKFKKSKKVIDEYYSRDDINADDMYERLIKLKSKSELMKVIIIPTFITLVFGVMVALGVEIIKWFLGAKGQFLNESKVILNEALRILSNDRKIEAISAYNDITNEVVTKIIIIIVCILLLLIAISVTITVIMYILSKQSNLKEKIYKHEIDKIEELINLPENKQIINKIKNIPTEEKQNE